MMGFLAGGLCHTLSQGPASGWRKLTVPEAPEVMIISLEWACVAQSCLHDGSRNFSLADELNQVSEEPRLGRSVEEVFAPLHRLATTRRTLCVSVLVPQQTGGNLVEVLSN